MNDPQIILESVKGIWAILGIFATGLVSWVGFAIKERHSRKKAEEAYRKEQLEKQLALEAKVDRLTEILQDFADETNNRLNRISTGLELCMEDDDLIFCAFRKTKILNGESEIQSKKLEHFRQGLMHESLTSSSTVENLDDIEKEKA